jgi:hypothetical protein
MNPKDGGAPTEVGTHNTIGVAMEDRTLEGTRGGDGCRKEVEARMFLENTHRGDQEDRPNRHDYRDYDIHGTIGDK